MEHDDESDPSPSDAALTTLEDAQVTPFRRPSPRGAAELFADVVMGADGPEKLPWWAKVATGVVAAAGVTATLAWSWFTAHAPYVLGPAFVSASGAFLLLRRGAKQRERRLRADVDQHTSTEVRKAVRDVIARIAKQRRRAELEGEAALAAAWHGSNPLGPLIRPYVFFVFLTRSVVRVHTYVCNVYHLPKMIRCTSCTVRFRRKDPQTGQFIDIAAPSINGWSAEIPAWTTGQDVSQPEPSSVSDAEADAIRAAYASGPVDVQVSAQYAVRIGVGAAEREISQDFQFPAKLIVQ